MSNLLGDFFTGSTMLGSDPEEPTAFDERRFVIKGTATVSGLYISPRLSTPVVGSSRVTGVLSFPPAAPQLTGFIWGIADLGASDFTVGLLISAPIEGVADLSSSILTIPPIIYLTGTAVGSSMVSLTFAVKHTQSLMGEVAVALPVTMTMHGHVLSEAGVKPDQGVDNEQITTQRPYFV